MGKRNSDIRWKDHLAECAVELYTKERLTIAEVSLLLGINYKTTTRLLNDSGVNIKEFFKKNKSKEDMTDQIYQLYVVDGLLMEEIESKVGVSMNTINKYLTAKGVDIKEIWKKNRSKHLLADQIVKLYTEDGLTMQQIQADLNVSMPTIKKYLENAGIDIKEVWKKNLQRASKEKEHPVSDEKRELMEKAKDLYLNTDDSTTRIAEKLGITGTTVHTYLKKQGVDTKTLRWEKLSKTNTGKKASPEAIRKMIEARTGRRNTPGTIEKMKESAIARPPRGPEVGQKISESKTYNLADFQEKHPIFCKIEPLREVEDKIQAQCKKCGTLFEPTRTQLFQRIASIENDRNTNDGNYFYCSDKCKGQCSMFKFIPKRSAMESVPYTFYEIRIWRQNVLDRDKQCLFCGTTEKLEAHHILPRSTHPFQALDPDNGITACQACHDTIHIGECSTVHLSLIAC